jgi:hypothetical protein
MAPSGILLDTFKALIFDSNNAVNPQNYNNLKQYFYPSNHLIIQKVDDPGKFVPGDPATIISYLNTDEANTGYFPQFYDGGSPNPSEHGQAGDVTPGAGTNGTYWDKNADKINGVLGRPVQYSFRYKKSNGVWLLYTALVTPV